MSLFFQILTIVLPIFLVIGLGYFLRRFGFLDEAFLHQTNRLIFYIALPLLLFYKIGTADFSANFNGALVIGSVGAITIAFLLSYGYAALRRYPPGARGAFSQGAFRGNLAYIGLAIVLNAYGETGFTRAGILMGFLVPALNFFAILALLLPHKGGDRTGIGFWLRQILFNPLIIASFAGILWSFFHLPLPLIFSRSLKIATGMTLPLALIGVFLAFFYTDASFTRTAYIGTIMMAGIVVNNAILVVYHIGELRERDLEAPCAGLRRRSRRPARRRSGPGPDPGSQRPRRRGLPPVRGVCLLRQLAGVRRGVGPPLRRSPWASGIPSGAPP